MKLVNRWESENGKVFDTEEQCRDYELFEMSLDIITELANDCTDDYFDEEKFRKEMKNKFKILFQKGVVHE